jgi:hypothetical protein
MEQAKSQFSKMVAATSVVRLHHSRRPHTA